LPKTYEYNEGKKAQEDFEEGMEALFQVPKDAVPKKKKPLKSGLTKPANPALPAILAARLKTL
jgi:hypothetical protein